MLKRMLTALLIVVLVLSVCGTAFADEYPGYVLKKGINTSKMTDEEKQALEDAISYMQDRLSNYEFYEGDSDGKFGEATRKAVIAFQRKNKLAADGKIGEKTWNALDADDSLGKNDPSFVVLVKGMKGDAVTEIKQKLVDYYYMVGFTTNEFDTATENAVKSFQESNGYTVDGKVGETTYDALVNGSAPILASGAIPSRSLSSGTRGYDVYILNDKLVTLNYLSDSILNSATNKGYYGAATAAAVRKFQTNNKITETGTANAETRRYIWPTDTDTKQIEDATKDVEYGSYKYPTLRKGSYGSYVALAQMRLKAGGFLLGEADRIFGVDTVNAVYKLQKRYGLHADGVIGVETWEVILALNIDNAEQVVVDPEKGSVGGATKTLRFGDSGTEVLKLQNDLQNIALEGKTVYAGKLDGKFGRQTRTAVRKIQKAYNTLTGSSIKVDGIVGPDTYSAINEIYDRQFK